MGYTAAPGAVISFSVEGAAASQRQIDSIAQSMGNLTSIVQGAMRNLAATVGLGGGLVEIVQLSDQYTKFNAQLRLATQSQREYAAAYADVKRIANDAQTDLAGTGVLYARISNGTRELGISQQRVASITEVVNLALKVSGATAEEAASAQLQLSQAFASGTLRGEEFNAVNEAAPRLMKALADGMGLPVGMLKQMASDGKITSQVMADVLPQALGQLRQEAAQVQTISGALTVLKNKMLEFTGASAQSNGTVSVLTGSIGLLADHLAGLAGTIATLGAARLGSMIAGWVTSTYQQVAAQVSLRASTISMAEAEVAGTAATVAKATADRAALVVTAEKVVGQLRATNVELAAARAAVAAAEAAGAQSFALRALSEANRELLVAESRRAALLVESATLDRAKIATSAQLATATAAHTAAVAAQSTAMGAATVTGGVLRGALGLLGGPIGAVITVLGLGATAWSIWGKSATDSSKQAAETFEEANARIIKGLDTQIARNERLIQLQNQGMTKTQIDRDLPVIERLAAASQRLNDINSRNGEFAVGQGKSNYEVMVAREQVLRDIVALTEKMQKADALQASVDMNGTALTNLVAVRERLTGVNKQYLDDLAALQTAREKGAVSEREYITLVSQLATDTYKSSDASKAATTAATKETEAYQTLIAAIRSKTEENRLELALGQNATDSQKSLIKLDQELASGKLKLSAAHLAAARAALEEQAASEQSLRAQAAQRDVTKYIVESTAARNASAAALQLEYEMYGKSADAHDMALVALRADADMEKKLADLRAAKMPVTDQIIAQLKAERDARVLVEQATLGQGRALAYATQLAADNKRFAAEAIFDERARVRALLEIDVELWRDRIRLAGDGTEAQKRLQEQYDQWYRNQLLKPEIDAQRKMWDSIEQTAHDTFISIFDSGKSAFDRLKDALKNGLLDLLYQMTVKKWIINISASVSGAMGLPGLAQAAGVDGGAGGSLGGLVGAAQTASSIYSALAGGINGSLGSAVTAAGNLFGSSAVSAFGSGLANGAGVANAASAYSAAGNTAVAGGLNAGAAAGQAIPLIAAAVASYYGARAVSGEYRINGIGNALNLFGIGGGLLNRAFGMGDKHVTSSGISGTLSDAGVTGNNYSNWHQNGGWFRSDRNGTETSALDPGLARQLAAGLAAVKAASSTLAGSLGISADAIKSYSKSFNVALTNDAAANEKALGDLFTGIGNEIAIKLIPGLSLGRFSQAGEAWSATLQRLAGEFDATNMAAKMLGKSAADLFGSMSLESTDARERLLNLVGGIGNLSQYTTSYATNFITEAERLVPVQNAVTDAMKSLGLANVTTREQFKATIDGLISSGALATEAGAKQFASLMALADAFAQVTPAARSSADILNERADLQKQLDQLTMSSTQLLAKQRAALDASNRSLFDQVQAAQQAKAAQDAAKTSLADTVTRMQSFAASARQLHDSLLTGSLSTLTPEQQYAETRRQYDATLASARAGDATAQGNLANIANAFLTASQKINGGDAQYGRDFAMVSAMTDQMAQWATGQADDAQSSLDLMTEQVNGITALNTTMQQVAQNIAQLPAAFAGAPVAGVAAPINYAGMGTLDMAPLVDEIKALRAEVSRLRADQQQQTGDLITGFASAEQQGAATVVAGVKEAMVDSAWSAENGRADIR